MRHETEMTRAILTNEKAREMIDYVSPIYSNSYVGLWIFQAIGTIMGEVCDMAEGLRYETNPATAYLLLDYWERYYGIPIDSSLTVEQRRLRIVAKTQTRGPCNPVRLASIVSAALGGIPVEITENVAKNTFLVNIRSYPNDLTPAITVLERMKPAHLIYQIRVAAQMVSNADLKVAIAMTRAEMYRVEVQS